MKKKHYPKNMSIDFNTRNFGFNTYLNPFSKGPTFHTNLNLKHATLLIYNSHKMVRNIDNI